VAIPAESPRRCFLRRLVANGACPNPVRIGTARIGLGAVAAVQGNLTQARPLFENALADYRKAGDRERARWSLEAIGRLALAEGDLGQAAQLLELSLSEARELGNEAGIAEASLHLARVAHARGDLVAARSLGEEGLGLARRLGSVPSKATG
jgi:tetratricopeptide (TPR) repeat protein